MLIVGPLGLGKTALLSEVRRGAEGFQVFAVTGVEPEHTVRLGGVSRLFGLKPLVLPAGTPVAAAEWVRDRLVAAADSGRPVLCCVDDAHWLDPFSSLVLGMAARRLSGTPVAMVLAGRPEVTELAGDPFAGVDRLWLRGLSRDDASALLAQRAPAGVTDTAQADIVELAEGNPLALVELGAAQPAERLELPADSRYRAAVLRRFRGLSSAARQVVALAVLEERLPADRVLAGHTGAAVDEACTCGLIRIEDGALVPAATLVGVLLHAELSQRERRDAHRALVRVLHPAHDRDRWMWHRAVTREDRLEQRECRDELANAAEALSTAGNVEASSTAWERAAALADRTEVATRWLLNAARDSWSGGRPLRTRTLLRQVRPGIGTRQRALAAALSGEMALRDGSPVTAAQELLAAVTGLAEADHEQAVVAAVLAGEAYCLTGDYAGFRAVAHRAAALRTTNPSPLAALAQDHFAGMLATYEGRHADAVRPLRATVRRAAELDDPLGAILASQAAYTLGDATAVVESATRAVRAAELRGQRALRPWALVYLAMGALLLDRHAAAAAAGAAGLAEATATGQRNCAADHLTILAFLAALRGDRELVLLRLRAADGPIRTHCLARPAALASWALACADLADARPSDALVRLRMSAYDTGGPHLALRVMAAPQVVEAAVPCHQPEAGSRALSTFDEWIGRSSCVPRQALSHRCHALLAVRPGDRMEHFSEAVRLHRSGYGGLEMAKTELLYAHELRRCRRPKQARELLREALAVFSSHEAHPWADRARAELRAAGESVAGGRPGRAALTAQQARIAELVADGATNREIAARLLVSHRTVEHHLRNIFTRLGVRSRTELAALLR
ncbi:regulatory protein, luxR family [Amycolatopsis australiensis]|uniref:Regulatory protein, luxR family n=1 Tax=Amycolatopsis australiensis TaxID=546364 RepID=A0A1K1SQA1_9PSEU|nr:regulatory protein, luxR family [Amycolatopsis australiensis]